MVRTRRSEAGQLGRHIQHFQPDQDVSIDAWSPRELRSHYTVTRRHDWQTRLVGRRLSTLKMPRIMYPESEDSEAEKFPRRSRRPVRVYFEGGKRKRKVKNSHAESGHRLRPLRPSNYMEESDKNLPESGCHVRRSGRQRKLLHHSFNESWITNDMKVKGYPRIARMSSCSDSSSEDEILQPKSINKQINGDMHTEDDTQTDKTPVKKNINQSPVAKPKKEKPEEEADQKLAVENGSVTNDSDKSETKKEPEQDEKKINSEGDEKTIVRGRLRKQTADNRRSIRTRNQTKTDINSHSQHETASDSDSTDSEQSDIVVGSRRNLRRSNRTRKPRNSFIESTSRESKTYSRRSKPFTMKKKYALRERKQKIIVRSQSPSTSSTSSSSDSEDLNVSVKNKTKTKQKSKTLGDHTDRALRDIQPIQLDGSIRFSSVGGLDEHIRCLREMVLFPLMYPQLFEKFSTHPPKGVLFHGPPGTGKTLLARALANECSIQSGQKVSFFMRKGADCLKKWVGESERNLKLLFQQASKMKPSIIFFDEIDALAPVRSARQDQVHTSVVGTLLTEMDGLCDRGEIIVIGATNRLDSVDPALRRAGRFDRELHFPTPAASQRESILRVLTSAWKPPPTDETIEYIANISTSYGGSDLKALCSESVLKALERTYPQVYQSKHALLIDPQRVEITRDDMVYAMRNIVAAGSRCAPPPARPLPSHIIPLLSSNLNAAIINARRLFPSADKSHSERINGELNYYSSVFLIDGPCSNTFLGPALLAAMEHCAVRELSISTLNQSVTLTHEHSILGVFAEIRRCAQTDRGCVLYIPSIEIFWPIIGESGANLILHLWQEISTTSNCFLIATTESKFDNLPNQVQKLFPDYKNCRYHIKAAAVSEVTAFLKPLFLSRPFEAPSLLRTEKLPELPKAPPPPAPRPTALEMRKKARREAHLLRELRIFLRDVCRKLAANRRFYKFTKPVDLEEVTDYLSIIKQPMDLETMMTKVDMHRYMCARDFLKDIDLICANALEYNPDRTSSDKQIRHEACSLRDHAYALVEVEMDTDFEEECRLIAGEKASSGEPVIDKDLPNFIFTANQSLSTFAPHFATSTDQNSNSNMVECDPVDAEGSSQAQNPHDTSNKRKRKKRHSMWSKGMVTKKVKISNPKDNPLITDEESKENKPLSSSSPINGEPSLTDNETGPSEHDKDKSDEVGHGIIKKLNLDKDEMLFDANAVDGVASVNRMKDMSSPEKSSDNLSTFASSLSKKRSSLEHSDKDCDNKLIIKREELEAALQKSVKSLKGIRLRPLIELYNQLDKVLIAYRSRYDRTDLPAELQSTVNKFVEALK